MFQTQYTLPQQKNICAQVECVIIKNAKQNIKNTSYITLELEIEVINEDNLANVTIFKSICMYYNKYGRDML